ncbi:MAG TPA: hypothetical protein VFC78_24205 [Tepidisphaeraceae bacterium]|nr:hypothetical protein [Tepidisphaeraceae bacterium]
MGVGSVHPGGLALAGGAENSFSVSRPRGLVRLVFIVGLILGPLFAAPALLESARIRNAAALSQTALTYGYGYRYGFLTVHNPADRAIAVGWLIGAAAIAMTFGAAAGLLGWSPGRWILMVGAVAFSGSHIWALAIADSAITYLPDRPMMPISYSLSVLATYLIYPAICWLMSQRHQTRIGAIAYAGRAARTLSVMALVLAAVWISRDAKSVSVTIHGITEHPATGAGGAAHSSGAAMPNLRLLVVMGSVRMLADLGLAMGAALCLLRRRGQSLLLAGAMAILAFNVAWAILSPPAEPLGFAGAAARIGAVAAFAIICWLVLRMRSTAQP